MLEMFDGFPPFYFGKEVCYQLHEVFFIRIHQVASNMIHVQAHSPPVVLLQVSFEYLAAAQMMVK